MLEGFIDTPQHHNGLAVFPVIAPQGPLLPFLLSTEIEGSGVLTVREHSEEKAPMLLARNNSLHPLLIFAGEELPGGSPARLIERSILLAGKHVTQIPASSLESGGWVKPDQEAEITEWLRYFPAQKQQVGILGFYGDQFLGLEALGSMNLYGPLHRRLLIRFMKKALRAPDQEAVDTSLFPQIEEKLSDLEKRAQEVVDDIEEAARAETKRVGIGHHFSLSGPVAGGELLHEGHLVHLSVCPAPLGAATLSGEDGRI